MELVGERIADGRVLTLIESFLKQGIMKDMGEIEPEESGEGTPLGGVICFTPIWLRWHGTPVVKPTASAAWPIICILPSDSPAR